MREPVCDKCGKPVPPWNNAVLFAQIYAGEPETANYDGDDRPVTIYPRHLFPVQEGGAVICEGSPSRAQYVGGPPDERPSSDPYYKDCAPGFARAFAKLRTQYPAPEGA